MKTRTERLREIGGEDGTWGVFAPTDLSFARTGTLRSKLHLCVCEPYQTVALCGTGIAHGGTLEEASVESIERDLCLACVRAARARVVSDE